MKRRRHPGEALHHFKARSTIHWRCAPLRRTVNYRVGLEVLRYGKCEWPNISKVYQRGTAAPGPYGI